MAGDWRLFLDDLYFLSYWLCIYRVVAHLRSSTGLSFIKVYNERNVPGPLLAQSTQGVFGELKTSQKINWVNSWASGAFSLRRFGSRQPGKTSGEGQRVAAAAVHLAVRPLACPCD